MNPFRTRVIVPKDQSNVEHPQLQGGSGLFMQGSFGNFLPRQMSSEETPLLTRETTHDLVYERFPTGKKKVLVAIVSWGGLVSFFTSGTFIPSIPQVARDLQSTGEVIGYAVSISILAGCVGGLIGSKYSKFYGRRPVYLWFLPLMLIGSFGVAYSYTVAQLLVWRFVQAMGAAPSLSVGAGVIGDIYKLEERGKALGIYYGAGLLGLAVAPVIGGFTAHYWSWRAIHLMLSAFALGAFFCILTYLPETSHPNTMGIDSYKREGRKLPQWRPVILNPLEQLRVLKSPNILIVTILGFLAILTDVSLMMPLAYTIGKRYGIENEALIGACLLPVGLGNAVSAPISGWLSDRIVISWKKKRGKWYPEDRLRASLYGVFLPLTVLCSGLITTYIPSRFGLYLNLLCLFLNGIGVDIVLTPCGTYVVDVLHENSAEVTAASNALRSFLLAGGSAALLPMIKTFGHLFTNTLITIVTFIGFGLLYLTIIYGDAMRAWADLGFSTADNT